MNTASSPRLSEETADHLPEVSEKAKALIRSNPGYAQITAQHAAEAVERSRA